MKKKEFARRRRRLMEMMEAPGVAVVPTASVSSRNRDVEYPLSPRQRLPLSLRLRGAGSGGGADSGARAGRVRALLPGARRGEGALGREPGGAGGRLPGLRRRRRVSPSPTSTTSCRACCSRTAPPVYYSMGFDPGFDHWMIGWLAQARAQSGSRNRPPADLVALDRILHDMRLVKSKAELRVMREAADNQWRTRTARRWRSVPAGHVRVSGGGRSCSTSSPGAAAERRLSLDRGRWRERLRAPLRAQRRSAQGRRSAACRRRRGVRLLRGRHHPHLSGGRALLARAARQSTSWCWRRRRRPSTRYAPATPATTRITRRWRSSPEACSISAC